MELRKRTSSNPCADTAGTLQKGMRGTGTPSGESDAATVYSPVDHLDPIRRCILSVQAQFPLRTCHLQRSVERFHVVVVVCAVTTVCCGTVPCSSATRTAPTARSRPLLFLPSTQPIRDDSNTPTHARARFQHYAHLHCCLPPWPRSSLLLHPARCVEGRETASRCAVF